MRRIFDRPVLGCGTTLAALVLLAGCGGNAAKDEQAAFDVCLASAKKDAKTQNATFAEFNRDYVKGSTGDAGMRVNIPYEMDGKKSTYQCVAEKQTDGTFKVTF